jgi:hypothetical protein
LMASITGITSPATPSIKVARRGVEIISTIFL